METDPLEERRHSSIASVHNFKAPEYKNSYDDRFKDEGYHSLSLGSNIAHQLVFPPLLDLHIQCNFSEEPFHTRCRRSPLPMCAESVYLAVGRETMGLHRK